MISDDPEGERPTSWLPTIVASGDTTSYETSDSLVFYLTRRLTPAQDAEIRKQIEEPVEYYEKRVWYYPWAVRGRANEEMRSSTNLCCRRNRTARWQTSSGSPTKQV